MTSCQGSYGMSHGTVPQSPPAGLNTGSRYCTHHIPLGDTAMSTGYLQRAAMTATTKKRHKTNNTSDVHSLLLIQHPCY